MMHGQSRQQLHINWRVNYTVQLRPPQLLVFLLDHYDEPGRLGTSATLSLNVDVVTDDFTKVDHHIASLNVDAWKQDSDDTK